MLLFHDRRVRFPATWRGLLRSSGSRTVLSDADWNHESRERSLLSLSLSPLEAKRSTLPELRRAHRQAQPGIFHWSRSSQDYPWFYLSVLLSLSFVEDLLKAALVARSNSPASNGLRRKHAAPSARALRSTSSS